MLIWIWQPHCNGRSLWSAGERCMAISVAVPVTDAVADALIERLVPQPITSGPASDRSSEMGPLLPSCVRANHYVDLGEQQGARVVVDGRGFQQDKQG